MSNITTHTPGIWKTNGSIVYSSDGVTVAQVSSRFLGNYSTSEQERKLNAYLISAAPEMLELLIKIKEALPDNFPLRDLINKARGITE